MSQKAVSPVWGESRAALWKESPRQAARAWGPWGRTLVGKNVANTFQRRRVGFERWIIEGYTIRHLGAQSG